MPNPISQADQDLFARVAARNLAFTTDIESAGPHFFPPHTISLLLVADDRLGFSDTQWGLSTLIHSLTATPPRPFLKVAITVAHRNPDVPPEFMAPADTAISHRIIGFNFAEPTHFSPAMYHQVWLFGDVAAEFKFGAWLGLLPNDQIQAVCDFMQAGRGVLALGDHGGLGSSLCGSIPRVRAMRHWFATSGPFGELPGPDMANATRNDTCRLANPADPYSGNQSDDIPQEIVPVPVTRRFASRDVSYVHPLLCGRHGVIRVLPDHPHEGECIVPADLSRTRFGAGETIHFDEFPLGIKPEIVATSTVLPGLLQRLPSKEATIAHSFGAICAYDGWRANTGRVVTDATWHHFLNLNLAGNTTTGGTGFANPAALAHLESFREYYRNILIWLIPRPLWMQAIAEGLWISIWENRMLEAVTPGGPVSLQNVDPSRILTIGRHSREVVGAFLGERHTIDWLIEILERFAPADIVDLVRPWPAHPGAPLPELPCWFDPEPLLDFAFGGIIIAIRERFPNPSPADKPVTAAALLDVATAGAAAGLARAVPSLQATATTLAGLARALV
jgi:hypothetical protein